MSRNVNITRPFTSGHLDQRLEHIAPKPAGKTMGNDQSFEDGRNVRVFLNPDTHEIRLGPADDDRDANEVFMDQQVPLGESGETEGGGCEEDEGGQSDDSLGYEDDGGFQESPGFRIITRLLGARSVSTRTRESDKNIPPPTPMEPSCELYNQIVQDSGESTCFGSHKNICNQISSRQLLDDTPSRSARVAATRNMLPQHPCVAEQFYSRVYNGMYSKDGSVYICSNQDGRIHLYDTVGGKFKKYKEVAGRDVGWTMTDTTLSHDQHWFAYSTWSPCIYVCNVWGNDEKHYSLDLRPDIDDRFCAFALRFSNDGNELVVSASDGYLYVYDRTRCDRILKIDAHQDDANAVSFADETSHIIFSGGDDGVCKVWDRRTMSESSPLPVGTFAGHKDGITYIDTKGDGRYLITNSKDQSIKLWDLRKFSPQQGIDATIRKVSSQMWDYRWQNVPKRAQKNVLKKLPGDTSVMTYAGHLVKQTLLRCHFSPLETTGQRYIYTTCAKGRVLIYDVLTGEVVKTLESDYCYTCFRDVSWHPTEPGQLVAASWDGLLQMWTYNPRADYVEFNERRRVDYW